MREAQFTARSANSCGLARNSRRLAVNSFVSPVPFTLRPAQHITREAHITTQVTSRCAATHHCAQRTFSRSITPRLRGISRRRHIASLDISRAKHISRCALRNTCTIPFLASRIEKQSIPFLPEKGIKNHRESDELGESKKRFFVARNSFFVVLHNYFLSFLSVVPILFANDRNCLVFSFVMLYNRYDDRRHERLSNIKEEKPA